MISYQNINRYLQTSEIPSLNFTHPYNTHSSPSIIIETYYTSAIDSVIFNWFSTIRILHMGNSKSRAGPSHHRAHSGPGRWSRTWSRPRIWSRPRMLSRPGKFLSWPFKGSTGQVNGSRFLIKSIVRYHLYLNCCNNGTPISYP